MIGGGKTRGKRRKRKNNGGRGAKKREGGGTNRVPPLSFFLTSSYLHASLLCEHRQERGARLQQVMMYRGKFPAENYPRCWSRRVTANHFLFPTRRQTYALQQCPRDLLNYLPTGNGTGKDRPTGPFSDRGSGVIVTGR